MQIKGRATLLHWLRIRDELSNERKELERKIRRISDALLDYYERKNRTEVKDPRTGVTYAKRQGTTQVWDNEALKKLLQKRKVPEELVFKIVPQEIRDDEALFQLMQDGIISIDDVATVSHIEQHAPYIIAVKPNAKKKQSDTDDD